MKLIDANKGYEVLDQLFSDIQKNNYVANQQMLDHAWRKWCEIPHVCGIEEAGKLHELPPF